MKPNIKKRTSVLYLKGLDTDIKCLFKAHCARRKISMREAVENWMKKTVQQDMEE